MKRSAPQLCFVASVSSGLARPVCLLMSEAEEVQCIHSSKPYRINSFTL